MKEYYRITEFAKLVGVTAQTLRNYDNNNIFKPSVISPKGHRLYTKEQLNQFYALKTSSIKQLIDEEKTKLNIGYVRVSSRKQKDDLQRQYNLMEQYLLSLGKPFKIIKSIGSGINYNNPSLELLISEIMSENVNKVFVLYKDRLVRFGFDLIKLIAKQYNVEIEVINEYNNTDEEELVTDLIQIITVFSSKLNGKRKYKVNKAKELLQND